MIYRHGPERVDLAIYDPDGRKLTEKPIGIRLRTQDQTEDRQVTTGENGKVSLKLPEDFKELVAVFPGSDRYLPSLARLDDAVRGWPRLIGTPNLHESENEIICGFCPHETQLYFKNRLVAALDQAGRFSRPPALCGGDYSMRLELPSGQEMEARVRLEQQSSRKLNIERTPDRKWKISATLKEGSLRCEGVEVTVAIMGSEILTCRTDETGSCTVSSTNAASPAKAVAPDARSQKGTVTARLNANTQEDRSANPARLRIAAGWGLLGISLLIALLIFRRRGTLTQQFPAAAAPARTNMGVRNDHLLQNRTPVSIPQKPNRFWFLDSAGLPVQDAEVKLTRGKIRRRQDGSFEILKVPAVGKARAKSRGTIDFDTRTQTRFSLLTEREKKIQQFRQGLAETPTPKQWQYSTNAELDSDRADLFDPEIYGQIDE